MSELRKTSHVSRPIRLLHLPACGFFLWGYLKIKVFQKCSADLHNLKQTNSDEINAIQRVMLLRVVGSILNPGRHCVYLDGRHVVGVIFKFFLQYPSHCADNHINININIFINVSSLHLHLELYTRI